MTRGKSLKRCALKRGGRIKRRTPLKVRGGSRFPKRRDAAFLAWVRRQECVVLHLGTGEWWPAGEYVRVEAAHLTTRGAGGDDVGNVVPLHWRLHREQEGRTAAFEAKYGVDLQAEAARLAAEYARRRTAGEGER